jgi:hypothetical protein
VTAVEQSLKAYMTAFERYEIDTVLGHFVFPCHFVSDGEEVALMPLATEQACRVGIERVFAWHRELGVAGGRVLQQTIVELTPRLHCLDAQIQLEDGSGKTLYDFRGIYTFVRVQDAWRIAAIAHNQIPRLLACLSRG